MTDGNDLQAALKKSNVRCLASSRLAEFGGTFTLRSVNAIFLLLLQSLNSPSTELVWSGLVFYGLGFCDVRVGNTRETMSFSAL